MLMIYQFPIIKKVAEGKSGCCWQSFQMYEHLKSSDCIVGRHGIPWTVKSVENKSASVDGMPEMEVIMDRKFEDSNLNDELFNNVVIDEVTPVFDVYHPNGNFQKSSPGNPSFVACLTCGLPPSKSEIVALEIRGYGVPLKFYHVEDGLVRSFSFPSQTFLL